MSLQKKTCRLMHSSMRGLTLEEAERRLDWREQSPEKRDALQQTCSYLEAENMVFSGASAAAGTCRALVVSTGMDSEFGKIANLTQSTENGQRTCIGQKAVCR